MLSYRFFFQTYIQERIMDDHTRQTTVCRTMFIQKQIQIMATLLVSWLAVSKIFKTQTFTVDLKNYESHECYNF